MATNTIDIALLVDRAIFLGLGCLIGYTVARVQTVRRETRSLRKKVDEVILHKDENGSATPRAIANGVALGIVVIATVSAAFFSSQSASKVEQFTRDNLAREARAQEVRDAANKCTSDIIFEIINSLGSRTKGLPDLSRIETKAKVQQRKALIAITGQEPDAREELLKYIDVLNRSIEAEALVNQRRIDNPFPSREEYDECLKDAQDSY